MIDIEIMLKALKLAWIPRLQKTAVPDYYLRKLGGLNFLLKCNYDPTHLNFLPSFFQSILSYFNELKSLYSFDQTQDLILFNNKEILVEGKTVFFLENGLIRASYLFKTLSTTLAISCHIRNSKRDTRVD